MHWNAPSTTLNILKAMQGASIPLLQILNSNEQSCFQREYALEYLKNGFTTRDVYRKGWRLLQTKKDVEEAIEDLADAGWLRKLYQDNPNGGPLKVLHQINPKILDSLENTTAKTDTTINNQQKSNKSSESYTDRTDKTSVDIMLNQACMGKRITPKQLRDELTEDDLNDIQDGILDLAGLDIVAETYDKKLIFNV